MVSVVIKNHTKNKVNLPLLEQTVISTANRFSKRKNMYIDVSVVDGAKIAALAMQYMGENFEQASNHSVLSFLASEVSGNFVYPPDGCEYVGDVVLNAEAAAKECSTAGKSTDEVLCFWVRHGTRHLMGLHHD